MAKTAAAQKQDESGIEFIIYTFDQPGNEKNARPRWEKKDTAAERQKALNEAEKLFNSGKYQKVEVKQKYFDKKKDRNVDVSLRVYEGKTKKPVNMVVVLFGIAVVLGGLSFAVTYVLAG